MNKAQLIVRIAEKTGLSRKDAEQAVETMLETITEELNKGEKVRLVGFGTFEMRSRKPREAKVPQTGVVVQVPSCQVPAFKPSKLLKDSFRQL